MPRESEVRIARLDVSAYRVPTDYPEADGTLSWDSTTHTRETMLEVGKFVLLSLVLAALGFVALSRKVGSAARARRMKMRHPEPGRVDAARHQQVANTSSR